MSIKDRKKIVFVTTVAESFIFFKGQLDYLTSYFDVYAVASDKAPLEEVRQRENIKTIEIPMEREISLRRDFMSLLKFIRLFSVLKPDIVDGNTPKGSLLSLVAAYVTKVPARIYMCHGLRYQGYSGRMRKLLQMMEKITCRCATKVLCVSQGVKDTLVADKICSSAKTKVVLHGSSNGINLDFFNREATPVISRKEYNLSEKDFVYIFVGRIVQDKGMNELLSAFDALSTKYDHLKLLLVGPKENSRNPISEKADTILKENKNIREVGPRIDIRPFLSISDVLVLPSYREGFGMVLIEAAAMDVPVIVSDIIGCNNVVIANENGIFVTPKDEKSLIEKMELMYKNDDLRNSIQSATRNSIAERFEQKKVWEALLEEYSNPQ